MKEFVLDSEVPVVGECAPVALRERLAAFVELTKPRITFLIVLTSAAGFCLGSKGQTDYLALSNALFGIALLSSGIAALNQYMERGLDARFLIDHPSQALRQALSDFGLDGEFRQWMN